MTNGEAGNGRRLAALREFLQSAFKPPEMAIWLRGQNMERVVTREPGDVEEQRFFDEVVRALSRRGLITATFFDELMSARPMRSREVAHVAAALGVQLEGGIPADRALRALLESRAQKRNRGEDTRALDAQIMERRVQLRNGRQLKKFDVLACEGEDRFVLAEQLGAGGFATVWRALDSKTAKEVAVKVLRGRFTHDLSRRERFFGGAHAMAQFEHPGIVRVHVPKADTKDLYYFVMELVDDGNLEDYVLKRRPRAEQVIPIILKIGNALAVIHQAKYVHRDVKPANVLMTKDGEPKLTDFDLVGGVGLSSATGSSATGTFGYAAPELLEKPKSADARADVFALGMTTLFALQHRRVTRSVWREPASSIEALDCPSAIKSVLKRALKWELKDRHKDVVTYCNELQEAMLGGHAVGRVGWLTCGAEIEGECQRDWADEYGEDAYGRWALLRVNEVCQRMRWVPSGRFLMGSPEGEQGRLGHEGPRHDVYIYIYQEVSGWQTLRVLSCCGPL